MPIRIQKLFDHLTIDTRGRSRVRVQVPLSITNQSGATRWYKLSIQYDNNIFDSLEVYAVDYGMTNLVLFSVDLAPPPVSTVTSKQLVITVKEYLDRNLTIQTDYLSTSVKAYFIGPDAEVIWVDDFESSTLEGWSCTNVNPSVVSGLTYAGRFCMRIVNASNSAVLASCSKTLYTNVLGYMFFGVARFRLDTPIDYIVLKDLVGGHYVTFYPTYAGYWVELATKLEPDTALNLIKMGFDARLPGGSATYPTSLRLDYVEWIRSPI